MDAAGATSSGNAAFSVMAAVGASWLANRFAIAALRARWLDELAIPRK